MKRLTLAIALAVAAPAAGASDSMLLEPGLRFAWTFGAARPQSAATLSLGLYPNDLGWRQLWADAGAEEAARLDKPAILDLHVVGKGGLRLMGLPLNARALGADAGDGGSAGSLLKPVLVVLAAGAATALVIGAAGDAAEDNNPAVNDPGGNSDVCGDDQVLIGDECVVGGG